MDKIKNEIIKVESQLQQLSLEKKFLEGYLEGLNFFSKNSPEVALSEAALEFIKISTIPPVENKIIDSGEVEWKADEIKSKTIIPSKNEKKTRKGKGGHHGKIYTENEKFFQQVKYILTHDSQPVHFDKILKTLKMNYLNKKERKRFSHVLYTRCAAGIDIVKTNSLTFGLKEKDYDVIPQSSKNWVVSKKENSLFMEKIKKALEESSSPLSISNLLSQVSLEKSLTNKSRLYSLLNYQQKKGVVINMGQNTWGLKEKDYFRLSQQNFIPIEKYSRTKDLVGIS